LDEFSAGEFVHHSHQPFKGNLAALGVGKMGRAAGIAMRCYSLQLPSSCSFLERAQITAQAPQSSTKKIETKKIGAHPGTAPDLVVGPQFFPLMIVPSFSERTQVAQTVGRPELSRSFESALLLPTRRFHRT
jgi:hypothetical protein